MKGKGARLIDAKIVANDEVAASHYRLSLQAPAIAREIRPGQFLHIRCSDTLDPILRRPFSVHRVRAGNSGTIEILYKIVGRGTGLLSKKRRGESVSVIGPLGNGFSVDDIPRRSRCILVAGGMGVAPLLALAAALAKKKGAIRVIIGAKTASQVLCADDFRKLGAKTLISTEDGSKGVRGLATALLKRVLSEDHEPWTEIFACGPNAMLKEVAAIAAEKELPCQVSLEGRMACGLGACLGCPVKVKTNDERRATSDEYKMVCKDGPVFDAKEIIW